MKIYTRRGDSGETSLYGGRRVPKDDVRVAAYGNVDELNSALGFATALLPAELEEWRSLLVGLQSDCFTIGAVLATPKTGLGRPEHIPELAEDRIAALEAAIDRLDEEIQPLSAFVLPGGSEFAAALHVARSVCRRAERGVVTLARADPVEPTVLVYLNRLSDLLFTLARAANARQGVADVEWRPGGEE